MQVLKKIALFFMVLGLFSCKGRLTDNRISVSNQRYEIIDFDAIDNTMNMEYALNVGVLLPLSGMASNIGQGLQNAMFLALDDLKNNKIILKFYDTKSTKIGAAEAAEKAIAGGAKLILGPLMSEEVQAVSKIALSDDIPVISFTTSPQVLQKGVYSIGMLNAEQIDRILSYAVSKNRTRYALLLPDNNSGLNILKSALMTALANNVSIVKVGFYNPDSVDFTSIVKELSAPSDDVDAILIADGGNRLKSMVSMFAYNDILYPDVLFLGTAAWDNTNLSKETMLYHGYYPMVPKKYGDYFTDKYKNTFGEQPKTVYSFAYDSVLLASVLAEKCNSSLDACIVNKNGFNGVNGYFRILPTGQSYHGLDVWEVTKDGPKVVSSSNKKDAGFIENERDIRHIPYDRLPKVYGKNSSEVWGWLYNN